MKTPSYTRATFQAVSIALSLSILQSCILIKGDRANESDYVYTISDGKATINRFNKEYSGALSIAKILGGCPVATVGKNAFQSCTNLTSVTIPNSVTSIDEFAFWRCSQITSVTIPDSVTDINPAAFCACQNLKSISIPGSVTNIGKTAFNACGLMNVKISEGVRNIDNGAFEECKQLTTVAIPSSVTNIADLAFSGCTGLKDATIGEGVTSLGAYAFSGCTSLTRVTFLGNAPERIREAPFRNVSKATVHYRPGTKGWGPEFCGRPTQCE